MVLDDLVICRKQIIVNVNILSLKDLVVLSDLDVLQLVLQNVNCFFSLVRRSDEAVDVFE